MQDKKSSVYDTSKIKCVFVVCTDSELADLNLKCFYEMMNLEIEKNDFLLDFDLIRLSGKFQTDSMWVICRNFTYTYLNLPVDFRRQRTST